MGCDSQFDYDSPSDEQIAAQRAAEKKREKDERDRIAKYQAYAEKLLDDGLVADSGELRVLLTQYFTIHPSESEIHKAVWNIYTGHKYGSVSQRRMRREEEKPYHVHPDTMTCNVMCPGHPNSVKRRRV